MKSRMLPWLFCLASLAGLTLPMALATAGEVGTLALSGVLDASVPSFKPGNSAEKTQETLVDRGLLAATTADIPVKLQGAEPTKTNEGMRN